MQSRYYDAVFARFLNVDIAPQISFDRLDILTSNMFAYCCNIPINMCDEGGYYSVTFNLMSSIVSAFSGAYIGAAVASYFGLKGWKKSLCIVGGCTLMGLVGRFFPLANLYSAVKNILYTAGYTYLSRKRYNIAAMAYHHGMWGGGASLSNSQKQKFISKIKSYKEYKNIKSILISRYNKGERPATDTLEFKNDMDLYYAIQHMSISLVYDSSQKRCRITMDDPYNFDEWRRIFSKTGVSFANAANNLGLIMQKCGMMIPYKINLQFND